MKITYLQIIFLFIIIFSLSCNKEEFPGKTNCYLLLERLVLEDGKLISGPLPPKLQIDFPTYSYDETTKILEGLLDFEINKDLQIIYGSGACLAGAAGGGCGTALHGIYNLPYTLGNIEIQNLGEDGSVSFRYNGLQKTLLSEEEWITEISKIDTIEFDGQISIIETNITETISNFGILKKSDIISW